MEGLLALNLYDDPWKIKKTLTKSDIDRSCRLLLEVESLNDHVLSMLDSNLSKEIETDVGARVTIQDHDTHTEHYLILKRWRSTGSYVLINNWKREFVDRRKLREGDEIGLLWNPYGFEFYFRVLNRA